MSTPIAEMSDADAELNAYIFYNKSCTSDSSGKLKEVKWGFIGRAIAWIQDYKSGWKKTEQTCYTLIKTLDVMKNHNLRFDAMEGFMRSKKSSCEELARKIQGSALISNPQLAEKVNSILSAL